MPLPAWPTPPTGTVSRLLPIRAVTDLSSFFVLPVVHFPWSERAREQRTKRDEDAIVA